MFRRRLLKLVLLTVVVASCHDAAGMPRRWGPLTLGRGDRCPNVAGRYFDSSAPVSWVLALRHIPRDSVQTNWAYFELAGVADTALTVTVATSDGVKHTARLARGTQYAGHYSCADGWLQFGDGAVPNLWDADIQPHDVLSATVNARLSRGSQALENGPDVPGQADMQERARSALLPGVLLRAVTPRDGSWHLSVEFEGVSQLAQFMTRLSQTGRVAELGVVPLYRAKTSNGHWTDVIFVRYER